jgi:hypothetical protein
VAIVAIVYNDVISTGEDSATDLSDFFRVPLADPVSKDREQQPILPPGATRVIPQGHVRSAS